MMWSYTGPKKANFVSIKTLSDFLKYTYLAVFPLNISLKTFNCLNKSCQRQLFWISAYHIFDCDARRSGPTIHFFQLGTLVKNFNYLPKYNRKFYLQEKNNKKKIIKVHISYMYSDKAPKFCEIFSLLLTGTT